MDPGRESGPLSSSGEPTLPSVDYYSWDLRLQIIGLGFSFYSAVFFFAHCVSLAFSHTYRSLLAKEKVFWDLAATRAIFGIHGSVVGFRALIEDSGLSRDRVRAQDEWSWFSILMATGFFIFENVALHISNVAFWTFDPPLAMHHFFALAGYVSMVVWDSIGHYLPMVTLLLEMSTPFTCISWMLLKAGWARSFFWKANQWVMIHMFHCRMVLSYYMWWLNWSHWEELCLHVAFPPLALYLLGLTLLTFVLNPIWTHKKTMQLLNPVDWNFDNKAAPLNDSGGDRTKKLHTS